MPGGRPAKSERFAFGERLTSARQQAGLTQQQLAEKLGTVQRVQNLDAVPATPDAAAPGPSPGQSR